MELISQTTSEYSHSDEFSATKEEIIEFIKKRKKARFYIRISFDAIISKERHYPNAFSTSLNVSRADALRVVEKLWKAGKFPVEHEKISFTICSDVKEPERHISCYIG